MKPAYSKRMAYSKLHSSLVNSSLWTEPDHIRLLFITLLALCDKDGCVYGSRPGLERAAMIDQNACKEIDPWDVLMGPDQHSSDKMRAPENEGRRIEEIPGGFRLLNFAYYRGLRNDDDRREQNRIAQEKFRNRSKPRSAKVSPDNPPKAHTEAEAETEADPNTYPKGVGWRGEEKCYRKETRMALAYLNEKSGRHYREVAANLDLIDARLSENGVTLDGVKQMLDRQRAKWKNTPQWEFFRPSTLFAPDKFDGYYAGRDEPLPVDAKKAARIADAKELVKAQFGL